MFIPVNTDAPLYHRPIGTVGLIAANVWTFSLTNWGRDSDGWLLRFNAGWQPAEWFTSAFFHFDFMHLIGNMIFLWAFGLILEGKLGFFKFLALYAAICALSGALTQTLMLGSERLGGAGGASGVIFGMMAIALIWAPLNTFETIWFYQIGIMARGFQHEMSVWGLSCWYLGFNLFLAWLVGFRISTPVLHLIGAIAGAPLGWLLLRYHLVDCEGWDILTRWKMAHSPGAGSFWGWKSRSQSDFEQLERPTPQPSSRDSGRRLVNMIESGAHCAAFRLYEDLRARRGTLPRLDGALCQRWVQGLLGERMYAEAARVLEEVLLPQSSGNDSRARLTLAGVQIRELQRPQSGLRTLEALHAAALTPQQQRLLETMRRAARRQIEEGVLEIRRGE